MKNFFKKLFSRFAFVGSAIILLFIIGVAAVVTGIYFGWSALDRYYPEAGMYVSWGLTALSWVIVALTFIHCANRDMVPETKIPWLLCIVLLNVFGVAIYIVFSANRPSRRQRRRLRQIHDKSIPYASRTVPKEELAKKMGNWADESEALYRENPFAVVCGGTKTEYFPTGERFGERFIKDLEEAKDYIFLEYFIIAKGKFWSHVVEVLERKAKEGVEVRVIYDDVGSMSRVRAGYPRVLKKKGIKCAKFNPFVPVVTNVHNNRDHRKIAVIDGKIGYTGGINLADEYFNLQQPYGHWKDTAVRLEGQAVKHLTIMFLQTYYLREKKAQGEDMSRFIPSEYEVFEGEGFVQPYGDGPRPVYPKQIGEDVYINILNGAKKYVYISTPYLIIDYRLREALCLAAERGVDVRILTPHIPDKKIPFALTRSNYLALMKRGVKIYEYTPGFVHAKNFIADDEVGVVGTINLDYRSLLHHYEDGVFMYKTKALEGLKADMDSTFAVSALQTEEDAKRNVIFRWITSIAKLFAPLF